MAKFVWIAVLGALGSLLRYSMGGWVQRRASTDFPWGTASVNLLGCFLFGVVWSMAEERMLIRGETRVILLSGFMGAFTTFSTFEFETLQFLRDGQWGPAVLNLALSVLLGLALMVLGLAIGRQI